jgi:hypothetical protein
MGDRQKLLAVGVPLPGPGPFIVYRGTSGEKHTRRNRGLSWTLSLDTACWFATRFPFLKSPAVYTATVAAEQVYCFIGHRSEKEFITFPHSCKLYPLTIDEMNSNAKRHTDAIKEANK